MRIGVAGMSSYPRESTIPLDLAESLEVPSSNAIDGLRLRPAAFILTHCDVDLEAKVWTYACCASTAGDSDWLMHMSLVSPQSMTRLHRPPGSINSSRMITGSRSKPR